tara:strand:- start:136 stop:567 length:432 start_codon:yes stop_codon:yes gene_type:complete
MNLEITQELSIPINEIQWRFSRSSGPGGQNINKTESKVEIIFNIKKSKALNPSQKNLLLEKLKNKIVNGYISIKVQEKRSQLKNRELAIQRLISLLKEIIMKEEKIRKISRPTKSSQKRRVESKKKRGELKKNRNNKLEEDFR